MEHLSGAFQYLQRLHEETGMTGTSPSPPPKELVREFEQALHRDDPPSLQTDPAPSDIRPGMPGTPRTPGPEALPDITGTDAAGRTQPCDLSLSEEISLRRGLDAIDRTHPEDHIADLTALLSRPADTLTPQDLLRIQNITGMLGVQARTGVRASQGTTEVIEDLLEQ